MEDKRLFNQIQQVNENRTPLKNMNIFNGLLTPVFQLYQNYLTKNSTPTTVSTPLAQLESKVIKKPRVNFHSIDDIVYGGNSELLLVY